MFAQVKIKGELDPRASGNFMKIMKALSILCPAMSAGDKAAIIDKLVNQKEDIVLCLIVDATARKQKIFTTNEKSIESFANELAELNLTVEIVVNGD